MIDRNMIRSMAQAFGELNRLNVQLATGQRVNKPSDDVPAMGKIFRLQRDNGQLATYTQTAKEAQGVLGTATSTLEQVSELLIQVKQLGTQAATETYNAEERAVMANEVDAYLDSIIALANVDYGGDYIFSGESTDTSPFATTTDAVGNVVSVAYQGSGLQTEVAVADGISAPTNIVGALIFQGGGDVFDTVMQLRDAMAADDRDEINRLLGELNAAHTDVRLSLGRFGASQAQISFLMASNDTLSGRNTERISDLQDADVADVGVHYNTALAHMQMVMSIAADNVASSILNFL
jgi:flagellar hook-associated protein 3 FlgL